MNDSEYQRQMEILEEELKNVDNKLNTIIERTTNGALLSYPNEFRDEELFALQERCTKCADDIVNRMQELQAIFCGAKQDNSGQ
ncbi:hypothetical protein [uncultured Cohaesibacter sp.]|uniref:hypothetical protein n=1 Tax=uncultured Cohaesibacter sp. TaxID=1002546 RepID=UPI002AAC2297|nr:hypothetical protein [uncultured Cohaesibacter sp.]